MNSHAVSNRARHGDRIAIEHALHIQRSKAVYTYIPKNACTTLRFGVVSANEGLDLAQDFGRYPEFIGKSRATAAELANAAYRFVVYRCPYRRLSSVFLDKVVSEGYPLKKLRANSFRLSRFDLANRFLRFLYDRNLLSAYSSEQFTFRDFVGLLHHPDALLFNHHWTPQSWFSLERAGFSYQGIFALEEFDAAAPIIEQNAGIAIQDTRAKSGHSTTGFSKVGTGCFSDTPVEELRRMKQDGRVPTHERMFDDRLRASVKSLYAEDIELYARNFGPSGLLFG